ncbi:hypothetical protein O181_098120, partial [Austropuccinia psidii MF-1]|nr:hypothetical protein [Austropuccinia psidii MF-1]
HKDSSGIISSTSNDFATAVNSVSLAGELKTPSLPPSVQISSIIPSQSLLPSRDEVFKEIKEVSISSLHLFQGDMDLPTLSFHASLEEQWDEEEEPEETEKLPPHCTCDHHIELEGLLPPVGVIYSLSKNESETLQAYISENVEKGFIRQSSSSTGSPVLFVKKKDGGVHLCVYYCKLNAFTRKNRYPVPPMNQLLTIFNVATIFSKIDLCCAYNLLRIKEGDEHLTAFRNKYGSYEYLAMPFGLTNAPASFQNLVNDIFADFLDIFVVVYLDDIMVFSSSQEEHVKHVASVLQRLRDNDLFAKASKCVLHSSNTDESDYALGGVLSLVNDSGKNPISFDSRKLLPAELNYEIHDKELPGIVWALKCWIAFLLSLSDSFSCRDDVYSERGVDFISKNPQKFHQALKQDEIKESRFFSIKVEVFSDLVDQIQKAVWQEKDYKEILKQLARAESVSDYTLEPQARLFSFKDRVVIPSNHELQLDILQKRHDSPFSGHPGQEKTLKLIKRDFYWAGMNQIIKDYVSSLCQQLNISRDLSTAFHPETDGQTERVNHILEQYLLMYVSYHKDDWHTWLPLAEFAYNNAKHSSTKQSPFFTIYGRNPSFDSIHISQDTPSGKLSTKLQSVQQVFKEELDSEIKHFKKYADRNRAIPPDFQPQDKVWLASKNIKTTRPTKKLLKRLLGPFEFLKKIGSHAYHLKLPQQWKSVHPVFHVSFL